MSGGSPSHHHPHYNHHFRDSGHVSLGSSDDISSAPPLPPRLSCKYIGILNVYLRILIKSEYTHLNRGIQTKGEGYLRVIKKNNNYIFPYFWFLTPIFCDLREGGREGELLFGEFLGLFFFFFFFFFKFWSSL